MKFFEFFLGVAVLLFGTWVNLKLYQWFILPLGAPPISYWHMAGASLFINKLIWVGVEPSDALKGLKGKVTRAGIYLMILGLGYLYRSLMVAP